jgi:hypothetical protein
VNLDAQHEFASEYYLLASECPGDIPGDAERNTWAALIEQNQNEV